MPPRQPNILLVMADQMSRVRPAVLRPSGWSRRRTSRGWPPRASLFENAYCNSPLCAPSRFSMMAGQLPSRIGAYDNAARVCRASVPDLRALPARAPATAPCLAGKMHFVGPDQLHGFEERLTTDIYPADFGWTPDWDRAEERIDWWFHNMRQRRRGRRRRGDQPARLRRRGRLSGARRALRPRPRATTAPVLPRGLVHPPARPLRDAGRRTGTATTTTRSTLPRGRPTAARAHATRTAAGCATSRRMDDVRRHRRRTCARARRAYYGAISYVDDAGRRAARRRCAARARRRHRRDLHRRPRRHARRARPLVQDELLRGAAARAADRARARPLRAAPRAANGLAASTCCRRCSSSADRDGATAALEHRRPSLAAAAAGRRAAGADRATASTWRRGARTDLHDPPRPLKYVWSAPDPPHLFDLARDPDELAEPRCLA